MTADTRRRVVLDAGPVLRYLQGIRPGVEEVKRLLAEARAGRAEVLMADINVAEVGRKIRDALDEQGTDLLLALRNAGVTIRPGSDDVIREAIRADLPLADAYAFATAKVTGARLWTTDTGDFKRTAILKRIAVTFFPRPKK